MSMVNSLVSWEVHLRSIPSGCTVLGEWVLVLVEHLQLLLNNLRIHLRGIVELGSFRIHGLAVTHIYRFLRPLDKQVIMFRTLLVVRSLLSTSHLDPLSGVRRSILLPPVKDI